MCEKRCVSEHLRGSRDEHFGNDGNDGNDENDESGENGDEVPRVK
jgi:hypothetical protein